MSISGGCLFRLALGLALLFVAGCGGDDGGTNPPPPSGDEIGAEGGAVQSADSRADVVIPPGALADPVLVTVEPATSSPAGVLAETAYDFGPDGTLFSIPATVSIAYEPANLPPGTFASDLYLARAAADFWVPAASSTVDSLDYTVSAPVTHFSTYGIAAGGGSTAADSLRAYVTDDPEPGEEDQFATFNGAMAYLAENLEYEGLGIVVWRTSSAQEIENLSFLFDLRVDVEDGHTPTLSSAGTMQIDAIGALNLGGFTIQAPGGLVINANRAVGLDGMTFPATSVINYGGVKNAPFPAADPGFVSKSAAAARRAKGSTVSNSYLGDSFTQEVSPGTQVNANYGISASTGNTASFFARGGLGLDSQLTTVDNFLQIINVDVKLDAQASVLATGNNVESQTNMNAEVTGDNNITVNHHVSGELGLAVEGIGSATLELKYNQLGNGNLRFGVKNLVWNGEYSQYVVLGVTALAGIAGQDYALNLIETTVTQDMNITLWEGDTGKVRAQLTDIDVMGAVTLRTMWENTWEFERFTVRGYAMAEVRAKLMDITTSYCNFEAGAEFRAQGVSAGLKVRSFHDEFSGGPHQFVAPPGAFFDLTLDHSIFSGGSNFGSESRATGAGGDPGNREGQLRLNEVQFTGEGADHFDITGVDVPVTITDCQFTQTGTPAICLALYEVGGAIDISGNSFTGGGLGLTDCPGTATIADNTMNITSASSMGIGLGGSAAVTIDGNTLTCASGGVGGVSAGEMNGNVTITNNTINAGQAAFAITVAGSNVTADNNPMLAGMILIADGQLHIAGNTISACQLIDDYVNPGLQNDPVADNDGLLPGMVMTRMDWDGNGCCDYPPEWNVQDENGACAVCDGVGGKRVRFK
jgi:hypothetical protein